MTISSTFEAIVGTLQQHRRTLWLGQSVDTSVLHASYADFEWLPLLTSVGCIIRRPKANGEKFDGKLRERIAAKGPLTIDSGGFVLMMNPSLGWNVGHVADVYERIDADHLISLDVPPGPADGPAVRRRKYEATLSNLAALIDRVGPRVRPVAHGATMDELDRNCRRIAAIVPTPPFIGLGGIVPVLQQCGSVRRPGADTPQRRIVEAVACVRSHFPDASLHLFGVGSLNTVIGAFAAGANSVDSIGWRQAAGFGSVYIPGRHRRLLTDRDRPTPCRPFINDEDRALLAQCRCPECRRVHNDDERITRLAHHFKPRAVHNIWVLYQEAADYLHSLERASVDRFLAKRLSDAWLDALEAVRLRPPLEIVRRLQANRVPANNDANLLPEFSPAYCLKQ
ncbi:hypothetical protein [Mesorhizobium sp.]|uniref:hypothetical protein n=1 Tax=Mesorhizobium sp. TaxID=1871066 RepID=UPI000FE9EC30|nr:hypothetical protein [Mesorhizobium sp.]RWD65944.1 MAG: hypothetical protein EOS37_25120 [Mesorhizobium sp.]TIV57053.1 MAG: hypothetical protein E5V80_24290 [Mesorhizobium sp.]